MPDAEDKPRKFHLDRYLDDIIEKLKDAPPELLLSKKETALVLNSSISHLETKAMRFGPDALPWIKISPGQTRVRLGDLRAWCIARRYGRPNNSETPTVVSVEPVKAQLRAAIARNQEVSEEF